MTLDSKNSRKKWKDPTLSVMARQETRIQMMLIKAVSSRSSWLIPSSPRL